MPPTIVGRSVLPSEQFCHPGARFTKKNLTKIPNIILRLSYICPKIVLRFFFVNWALRRRTEVATCNAFAIATFPILAPGSVRTRCGAYS